MLSCQGKAIHESPLHHSDPYLARILSNVGGILVRKRGDHHCYRLPSGKVIPLPMGGKHREVSHKVRRDTIRTLLADGISIE